MSTHTKSAYIIVFTGCSLILLCGVLLFVTLTKENTPIQTVEHASEVKELPTRKTHRVIGTSVEGREIEAYSYGSGKTHLLFVGGIHGGYEWNSVLLSYAFIDHFAEHPEFIPKELTVTIVPTANPDGIFYVTGKTGRFTEDDVSTEIKIEDGRFNAHKVDLNRNFDCKWKPKSMWRGVHVHAGTSTFSEPESRSIRDFVLETQPTMVVFWHSQANAVYASECEKGILEDTRILMETYARAAEYPAIDSFNGYQITGDAEGWLASINVPAITVELSNHTTLDWEKNIAGMQAVLDLYRQKAVTISE